MVPAMVTVTVPDIDHVVSGGQRQNVAR
jgi:hypothetical protein